MPNKSWLITIIFTWLVLITLVTALMLTSGCVTTEPRQDDAIQYITGEAVYAFLMAGGVKEQEA